MAKKLKRERRWGGSPEACQILGWSKQTLHQKHSDGSLPFPVYVVGRRLRFNLNDIEDWLLSMEQRPRRQTEPEVAEAA